MAVHAPPPSFGTRSPTPSRAMYTVDAQYVFSGSSPLRLGAPLALSAIAFALDVPAAGVRPIRSAVSTHASVRIPGMTFDYATASNVTLSNAFARASNLSYSSVALEGFSAVRRKVLATDTAHFAVALASLDAADEMYYLYRYGVGNETVAREFRSAGVQCDTAQVTMGDVQAEMTVRADVPVDVEASTVMERASNASALAVLNAQLPNGVVAVMAAQPAVISTTPHTRANLTALVVFATAPAAVFATYVCFKQAGKRGRSQSLPRTTPRPVKKLKL